MRRFALWILATLLLGPGAAFAQSFTTVRAASGEVSVSATTRYQLEWGAAEAAALHTATLDVSACTGGLSGSFQASTGDASDDARFYAVTCDVGATRYSTTECLPVPPLNRLEDNATVSFSSGSGQLRFASQTPPAGGDTARIVIDCTTAAAPQPYNAGVPGLTGTTGDEQTLGYLNDLQSFQAVKGSSFKTHLWYDPFEGSDTTGDGSYARPYQTLLHMKRYCWRPFSRCSIKGRNATFSNRMLTVTYASPDAGPLIVGEAFTTIHPIGGTADDCAASCGTVLVVEGNKVILRWADGIATTNVWGTTPTDKLPRIGSVITGVRSGAVATVAAMKSTLTGQHSVLWAAADMSVANPSVFTVDSHGHANNDGPFVWGNQTTFPTMNGAAVTEHTTRLYTCSVTANTFQLSTSSTCTAARVGVSATGTGINQLLHANQVGVSGTNDEATVQSHFTGDCGEANKDQLCLLIEGEYPDAPARIDAGGFYWDETRGIAWATGTASVFWPGWDPTGVGGSNYNTPIGYGIGTGFHDGTGKNGDPDGTNGWMGVQSLIVSNLSMDGFATGGQDGKLIALNSTAIDLRNGPSDRSMTGGSNPHYQAHNSLVQFTGDGDVAGDVGGVGYLINFRGYGSTYEGSYTTQSGGVLNNNNRSVGAVIGSGMLYSDALAGDTACGGSVCYGPFAVLPSGEFTVVGPMEWRTGENTIFGRVFGSGMGTGLKLAKLFFNHLDTSAPDTIGSSVPFLFSNVPLPCGYEQWVYGNEITVRSAGPLQFFSMCEAAGTVGSATPCAAGNQAKVNFTLHNLILDERVGTYDYFQGFYCGGGNNCTDALGDGVCGLGALRGEVTGAIDHYDGGADGRYYINPNNDVIGPARDPGACTPADSTFRELLCLVKQSRGLPLDEFKWFVDNSVESGGSPTVNGNQYLRDSTQDPFSRCSEEQDCWQAASPANYTISLQTERFAENFLNETCIPPFVVGAPICKLNLSATSMGAR